MAVETLGLIAVGLSAVGTGVAMYGAVQQANASEAAAKFNAGVARNNSLAARQQAAFDQEQLRNRHDRLRGMQIASGAKTGQTLSGTLLDVQYDSDLQAELDMLSVVYKGQVASGASTSQAGLFESEARSAKTSGYLNAGATLLTGAGSTASTTAGLLK